MNSHDKKISYMERQLVDIANKTRKYQGFTGYKEAVYRANSPLFQNQEELSENKPPEGMEYNSPIINIVKTSGYDKIPRKPISSYERPEIMKNIESGNIYKKSELHKYSSSQQKLEKATRGNQNEKIQSFSKKPSISSKKEPELSSESITPVNIIHFSKENTSKEPAEIIEKSKPKNSVYAYRKRTMSFASPKNKTPERKIFHNVQPKAETTKTKIAQPPPKSIMKDQYDPNQKIINFSPSMEPSNPDFRNINTTSGNRNKAAQLVKSFDNNIDTPFENKPTFHTNNKSPSISNSNILETGSFSKLPLSQLNLASPRSYEPKYQAVHTQTEQNESEITQLKTAISTLQQKVLFLESELKRKDESIMSLTNTGAYLHQQAMQQLGMINQLMNTTNYRPQQEVQNQGYASPDINLVKSLSSAELQLQEKDKIISEMKNELEQQSSASKIDKRLRSERRSISPEHEESQRMYKLYKERQRESALGELLKWSNNESRGRFDKEITAKITDSPIEYEESSSRKSPLKCRECELNDAQMLDILQAELSKELTQKEDLLKEYSVTKYVMSPIGKKKKKQLECELELKDTIIKNIRDRIASLESENNI